MITVKMTAKQAAMLGIIFCKSCGHPPNNHFSFTFKGVKQPCAHCTNGECKGYKPKIILPK